MKIALCPGHSENSPGIKKLGVVEYTECKLIVDTLAKLFKTTHVEVEIVTGSLIEKVEYINNHKFDLAIEVHLEDHEDKNIRGSSSYYMMRDSNARCLAESLSSACALILKSINNGPKVGWFNKISPTSAATAKTKPKIDLFLSKINCTSVIVCPFHISNVYEITKYRSLGVDVVAQAIFFGLENYLRVQEFTKHLTYVGEENE